MIDTRTYNSEHYHIITTSQSNTEFSSVVYESEYEAAVDYCAMLQEFFKYKNGEKITIENVMGSIKEGEGMHVGVPGFVFVFTRCEGQCGSTSWN